MQFEAIATPRPNFGAPPAPWDGQMPWNLPMDQGVTLSNILKSFTLQPDQMWYLVWEGYGSELSETLAERPHRRYLAYVERSGIAGKKSPDVAIPWRQVKRSNPNE